VEAASRFLKSRRVDSETPSRKPIALALDGRELAFDWLRIKHGAMQKIQVLFPEPVLRELREIAELEDRPLSEVVRRAAEQMVRTYPKVRTRSGGVVLRTVDGGPIVANPADLRGLAYEEDRR